METCNSAVLALFEVHAPLKTTTIKTRFKSYITYTIRKIIPLKDKALKGFKQTGLASDRECYKDLRNYLSFAIREEKRCN